MMKKLFKTMISGAVAIVMIMSMWMAALAADGDTTITITKSANDTAGHKYSAYQILTGDLEESGTTKTLTNVAFGNGVDSAALLAALGLESTDTASAAASLMEDMAGSDLVTLLNGCLATTTYEATGAGSSQTTSLVVPGPGYYLIKDELTGTNKNGAVSAFVLKVVEPTEVAVTAKTDVPTIDKVIVETDGDVKANAASIGDTVTFKITSAVPEQMDQYNKYYFIVNDTLSKGLTYDASKANVSITIGGVAYTDYVLTATKDTTSGETSLKIVFNDFIEQADNAGDAIVITYNAILNDECDRTEAGNPNTVNLTYSNDPNHTYVGENEPGTGEDDVTGVTPDVVTKTYTTGVKVIKVDELGEKLTGAEFMISGEGVNRVFRTYGKYTEDASGTYYLLKDGTYTTTEPNDATASKYADTEQKYSFTTVSEFVDAKADNDETASFVDENGYLVFAGLGDGTYTITETKAPDGYEMPVDPTITFEISSEHTVTAPAWKIQITGKDTEPREVSADAENLIETFTVTNTKNVNLPGTGGIGTTIFYVAGGVLILAGVVALVLKKKSGAKE